MGKGNIIDLAWWAYEKGIISLQTLIEIVNPNPWSKDHE